ncbi:hypothetical protein G4Z16_00860 [Streptomyces bathyalis]|uniref:Uncharacterized protein n=1 Tax=Streptomyces bathyalis TaxID=2710756 RepID=A0A7T1T2H1_9ACTN|nr:hypothetical protein [Streptomyces bathyalis]QPP05177.1 hypothetical protein G4Z16_00860 [Streptomyces bathyalis]
MRREGPEPDPVEAALKTAAEIVTLLTGQLEEIWHPGEVAWHLHALAADEDSLYARLEQHLLQTAHWCQAEGTPTGRRSAAELAAAAGQLASVREAVTGQTGLLSNLAHQPAAPRATPTTTAADHPPPPRPGTRPPSGRGRR